MKLSYLIKGLPGHPLHPPLTDVTIGTYTFETVAAFLNVIGLVERSAAVAVVLDRVPPRAMADVPPHLGQMMSDRGLGGSPLFAVPETSVDAEGLLPVAAVQPIRGWLAALAADRSSRTAVVHRTLDGAIAALTTRTPRLAAGVGGGYCGPQLSILLGCAIHGVAAVWRRSPTS